MDLHPILVHFPIALLTLYSVLELISVGRVQKIPGWLTTKSVLVILGGLSLLLARQTGESTARLVASPSVQAIIHEHAFYANLAVGIYGVIAAGHCFDILRRWAGKKTFKDHALSQLWKYIFLFQSIVTETPVSKLLAALGLVALLVTGALGGAMIYGPNVDPFVKFIYNLLF